LGGSVSESEDGLCIRSSSISLFAIFDQFSALYLKYCCLKLVRPCPVIFALLLWVLQVLPAHAQSWSAEQLELANTASDADYLTQDEKDAVLYINLCRMYPQDFLAKEVIPYEIDAAYSQRYQREFIRYKLLLVRDLEAREPCGALKVDKTLFNDAKCYAKEISTQDRSGHQRIDCKDHGYAECLSFGQESGLDLALQWLLDIGVSSLGHRKICLEKSFTQIGLRTETHFRWDTCAVAEFQ